MTETRNWAQFVYFNQRKLQTGCLTSSHGLINNDVFFLHQRKTKCQTARKRVHSLYHWGISKAKCSCILVSTPPLPLQKHILASLSWEGMADGWNGTRDWHATESHFAPMDKNYYYFCFFYLLLTRISKVFISADTKNTYFRRKFPTVPFLHPRCWTMWLCNSWSHQTGWVKWETNRNAIYPVSP